jgi:hypothetical protein
VIESKETLISKKKKIEWWIENKKLI